MPQEKHSLRWAAGGGQAAGRQEGCFRDGAEQTGGQAARAQPTRRSRVPRFLPSSAPASAAPQPCPARGAPGGVEGQVVERAAGDVHPVAAGVDAARPAVDVHREVAPGLAKAPDLGRRPGGRQRGCWICGDTGGRLRSPSQHGGSDDARAAPPLQQQQPGRPPAIVPARPLSAPASACRRRPPGARAGRAGSARGPGCPAGRWGRTARTRCWVGAGGGDVGGVGRGLGQRTVRDRQLRRPGHADDAVNSSQAAGASSITRLRAHPASAPRRHGARLTRPRPTLGPRRPAPARASRLWRPAGSARPAAPARAAACWWARGGPAPACRARSSPAGARAGGAGAWRAAAARYCSNSSRAINLLGNSRLLPCRHQASSRRGAHPGEHRPVGVDGQGVARGGHQRAATGLAAAEARAQRGLHHLLARRGGGLHGSRR